MHIPLRKNTHSKANFKNNHDLCAATTRQALRACTFRHWDDHITFAAKAKRFPTGRGPRAIACTQDCSFCAVK